MKKLLMAFLLLTPVVAIAADCSELDQGVIDQRLINNAPDCIASGDYTSKACATFINAPTGQLEVSLSHCKYFPYEHDPRFAPLNEKLMNFLDASMHAKNPEWRVNASKEPLLLERSSLDTSGPTAAIAVCDTTERKNIEQRFISVAPSCTASGDFSSKACDGLKLVLTDSDKVSTKLKASHCKYVPYEHDSRFPPIYKEVISFIEAYADKENKDREGKAAIEVKATPNKAPPATEADFQEYDDGSKTCNSLIADIVQKYDVTNLKLMNNGNHHITESLVSCIYRAERSEAYVNTPIPITLVVTYNVLNRRYEINFR